MRPRPLVLLLFSLLAAAAIGATVALNGGRPVRVRIASPQIGRVEEVVTANSAGTLEPLRTAVLSAEIPGRIEKIALRQGSVQAGQAILYLDSAGLRAEREVLLRDGETLKMRLVQAAVARRKVEEDLERIRRVDVPRGDIDRLERDLEFAATSEEIARLSVRSLEAQMEVLDLRLRKTTVAAPFDGTVVALHAEEGEFVTAGRPLLTLHSAGPLLVRAPLDEVDLGRVTLGLVARVSFDSCKGRAWEGEVHEIMPAASPDRKNNRTVDVKIRLPEIPLGVVAGMSANVEIILCRKDNVLRLPTHLIHDDREGRGPFVYVLERGAAARRGVKTGISNWESTEILEGVTPADRIVVPLQFEDEQVVREGSQVDVVPDGR